jgi:hypothetical protein
MAMDFFAHQGRARRRTGWLVLLFTLAVIAIIALASIAATAAAAVGGVKLDATSFGIVLAATALVVALIVAGGSAYKLALLSGGGHVVAESRNGRLLDPGVRADPGERRQQKLGDDIAGSAPIPASGACSTSSRRWPSRRAPPCRACT